MPGPRLGGYELTITLLQSIIAVQVRSPLSRRKMNNASSMSESGAAVHGYHCRTKFLTIRLTKAQVVFGIESIVSSDLNKI